MHTFLRRHSPLIALTLLTLGLYTGRILRTQHFEFGFLLWNLFLAYLPLYFSHRTVNAASRLKSYCWAGLWLLFFPNAAYIITDLFHLYAHKHVPLWYDLILLCSAAICGLSAGFLSLRSIEKWLSLKIGAFRAACILPFIMLLSGYGIYLGRYMRWNSWDLFVHPFGLGRNMAGHLLNPAANTRAWGLSIIFGIWMYVIYIAYKQWRAYETH